MTATIRDVARLAAVSVASASRAMNGHRSVSPDLRTRVLDAAAQLHFVPHAGARGLVMRRTQMIGVVLPHVHGDFFSEFVRGMERMARGSGYQLLLSSMHEDPAEVARSLGAMRGRVDGLVIMPPHLDLDLVAAYLPDTLPAVLVYGQSIRPIGNARFSLDNHAATYTMINHLVATGRRNIVHVSGPPANHTAIARIEGYRAAMAALLPGAAPLILTGDFTEEGGAAAARSVLAEHPATDAIFCGNDITAIGCMTVLRDAGIAVPQRIAVAGFDDVPLARLFAPTLTTMRIDVAGVAARALTRLIEEISGTPGLPADEILRAELIVRDSTVPRI
jgi:LacI family transcriptional regulator